MTELDRVLGATPAREHRVRVARFPASLQAAVEPFADADGHVLVPAFEREEVAWVGRIPGWFCTVPNKKAVRWQRQTGEADAYYPELVVRDLLERAGWEAAWVKNFGGRAFWADIGRDGIVPAALTRPALSQIRNLDAAVLESLAADGLPRRSPPGGCWDVFGWRRGRPLFLETKEPGEPLNKNQIRWLGASLASGVGLDSFAVVQYVVTLPGA